MSLSKAATARMKAMLEQLRPGSEEPFMSAVLRLAAKWRSQMLANTILVQNGTVVQGGPFAGMDYVSQVAEGGLAPRLIGSYESELHPFLTAFVEQGLDHVVDIGCAEGYYAVGMARLAPGATIHAYDIDPKARAMCADLAARNAVSDRVRIGEEFHGEEFAYFVGKRALVIVDIEGAERDLLDPDRFPGLKQLSLIVETHPGAVRGITGELIRRFSPSHRIEVVRQGHKATPLPAWLDELGHLDGLLAVWEWRASPTPWLVMQPKRAPSESPPS